MSAPISNNSGPTVKAKISGLITTYFGAPIPGLNVILYDNSVSVANVATDSNGAFQFAWLNSGDNYTVFPASNTFFYFDNAYITKNPLTADVTMQFLKMSDVKSVSGYIKDPTGNAMPSIIMSLSGTHSVACASDNTGCYNFYVTTETYSISVSTNNPSYYTFSQSSYALSGISANIGGYNFMRLNRPPSLACGYTSSVIEPSSPAVNQNIAFRIMYSDPDNDAPKTNYPMVYILQAGATVQTLSLSSTLTSTYYTGVIYSGTVSLSKAGSYSYNILANDYYGALGNIYSGSFQVSAQAPNVPQITSQGLTNGASVTSGQVVFSWDCPNPSNDVLTYTLLLSNPQTKQQSPALLRSSGGGGGLNTIYSGTNKSYTKNSLESGMVYYWQVQAANQYGVLSLSPEYSFTTINEAKRAYTYPRSFNPARGQNINIVFEMEENGSAEVQIYSEFGNLCWERSFYDLSKGTNQVSYNGRDGSGNVMYNGTYPVRIRKHYPDREQEDKCRVCVIK
jgi:hypothetical protein